MNFFTYDYEDGFTRFNTLNEARAAAETYLLPRWRKIATNEGEWPDEAAMVCYGEIRGRMMEWREGGTVDYRLMEPSDE